MLLTSRYRPRDSGIALLGRRRGDTHSPQYTITARIQSASCRAAPARQPPDLLLRFRVATISRIAGFIGIQLHCIHWHLVPEE